MNFGQGGGPVAVSCEHDCALVGAVHGEMFLNLLNDCWLLKENFTPRN